MISDLLASGPNDPIAIVILVLLIWLPLCAVGLTVLWVLAWAQEQLGRRRPRRPAIVLPPTEVRPLATRRYASAAPRSGALRTVRIAVVVAAVAAGTAFLLSTSAPALLAALGR